MKLIYKVLIFFTVFYVTILMVNAMEIFPNTFYSDQETGITSNNPGGVITSIFVPALNNWGLSSATAAALTAFIVGGAIGTGILVQSPVLPSVIIMGYLFFNMMTRSYDFFDKLFTNWGGQGTSIFYLGLCIGAGLFVVGLISIIEMVAQGRSGGD